MTLLNWNLKPYWIHFFSWIYLNIFDVVTIYGYTIIQDGTKCLIVFLYWVIKYITNSVFSHFFTFTGHPVIWKQETKSKKRYKSWVSVQKLTNLFFYKSSILWPTLVANLSMTITLRFSISEIGLCSGNCSCNNF